MSVNVLFQVSSDSDAKLVEMCKRFTEKPVEVRREGPENAEEPSNGN